MTDHWYQLSSFEWNALILSLKISIWSILLSLPFGIALSWLLAKKEFRGKTLVESFLLLPLVLPPVVVGYLLLIAFGQNGVFGSFLHKIGIELVFNWKGACLAAIFMSFPLLVRSLRISFEAIDKQLEEVATTLGAKPLDQFFSITLPLCLPGLISGSILAFTRCLGEFGATITFVSNIPEMTQTLPLALYTQIQMPNQEMGAYKLCVISIIIAVVAIYLSELSARWMQKRLNS